MVDNIMMSFDNLEGIVGITAASIAAIGLVFTAIGLYRNARITKAEFYLTLREMISKYDEIDLNLRGRGKWTGSFAGPTSEDEWVRVVSYMALFEYCMMLAQDKLIDLKIIKYMYGLRIGRILKNRVIVKTRLIREEERENWSTFIELCKQMELWTSVDSIKPKSGKRGSSLIVTVNGSSLRDAKNTWAYTNDPKLQVAYVSVDTKSATMNIMIEISQDAEPDKKSIIIEIPRHSQEGTIEAKLMEAEFEVEDSGP